MQQYYLLIIIIIKNHNATLMHYSFIYNLWLIIYYYSRVQYNK